MWPGRNNVPLVAGIRSGYKENCAVNSGYHSLQKMGSKIASKGAGKEFKLKRKSRCVGVTWTKPLLRAGIKKLH